MIFNKNHWSPGSRILDYKKTKKALELYDANMVYSQYSVYLGMNTKQVQLLKHHIDDIKRFVQEYQSNRRENICVQAFVVLDSGKSTVFLAGGDVEKQREKRQTPRPFIKDGKFFVQSWQLPAFKADIMQGWTHMLSKFDFTTKGQIVSEINRVFPSFSLERITQ